MSEKQNQLFMYVWSRRRTRGALVAAASGAGIGALGGLLFALILAWPSSGAETGFREGVGPPAIDAVVSMAGFVFGRFGAILVMAAPAFAWLGGFLAYRVFNSQEAIYQSLLAQGVTPPAAKPVLAGKDRWPQYAVIATVVLIAVFILCVALFVH